MKPNNQVNHSIFLHKTRTLLNALLSTWGHHSTILGYIGIHFGSIGCWFKQLFGIWEQIPRTYFLIMWVIFPNSSVLTDVFEKTTNATCCFANSKC